MKFSLPTPPSVNNYYGDRVGYSRKFGKNIVIKYVKKAGKDYRANVAKTLIGSKVLEGRLRMKIDFYPRDRRRHDGALGRNRTQVPPDQ